MKLQVNEEDVPDALKILEAKNELEADYSDSLVKCPNCKSGNVDGVGLKGKLSLLIVMITAIPILIKSSKFRCYDCKTEFIPKKNSKD